jgi:hypothetical protein
VEDIFRTCNPNELFVSAINSSRIPFIAHTVDGGITWENIDIPSTFVEGWLGGYKHPNIRSFNISPKGTAYLILDNNFKDGRHVLYKKSNITSCKSIYIEPDFGTTIITHGYQPPNPDHFFPHPIEAGGWAYNIGKEILAARTNNEGCICRYNKTDGNFDVVRGDCNKGETVLIFDWMDESNNFSEGYSEAAGDALFSALLLGIMKGKFNLRDIHFIGHSRGTVVNTEAIERLLTLKSNSESYANSISIDQVTNLDSHDWGALDANIVKDDDNHPNINIPCPSDRRPNNGTISWKGSGFNDSYYQKGNPAIPLPIVPNITKSVILDGRPVDGTYNVDWSKEAPGHSLVHERYLKTIISANDNYQDGYKYSRLSGETRPQPKVCGNIKYSPEFDFFQPMEIYNNNSKRIRGIMNGSFDRYDASIEKTFSDAIAPGWIEHGGGQTDYPNSIFFNNGYASLTYFHHFKEPVFLRHNRFYIPNSAKSITFNLKTENLKEGTLIIYIIDASTTQKRVVFQQKILDNISQFKEFGFDIKPFQNKVVTMEFSFKGIPIGTHVTPNLAIDDVSLSQKETLKSSEIIVEEITDLDGNTEEQSQIENAKNGISDGTFLNLINWSFEGGEVGLEREAVFLKPQTKKKPVKLKHDVFKVPTNSQRLTFQVNKEKIIRADLSLKVIDVKSGESEIIYLDKIRVNLLDKLNSDLEELDESIENLDFDNFNEKFEDVNVSISKYRGRLVSIVFEYTPIGNSKPRLYIDNLKIE